MLVLISGGSSTERADIRRKYALKDTSGKPIPMEELDILLLSPEELAGLAGTPTLTGEMHTFFLRGALSSGKKDTEEKEESAIEEESVGVSLAEELPELAEGLAQSVHTFVLEEEKVTAKLLERFKKARARLETLEKPEKKEVFNVFALGEAFAKRDRKKLWLLSVEAFREGLAPENIGGVLAWKARTMLASARTLQERTELQKLSHQLVALYHDSHRGAGDLALLLERFALTL